MLTLWRSKLNSVDKAECSPFIWTFFGYLRCTDSLSELESIGRSNLTWPASPATELGRTVLPLNEPHHEKTCFLHMGKQRRRSAVW